MRRCPRRPKFRPDFEAPGPQVRIESKAGIGFVDALNIDPQDQEDEDDDMPSYRYYESTKIIGRLYRAIDERALYQEICKREAGVTSHSSVIDELWFQVQIDCKGYQWEHKRDWARDVREM